MMRTLLVLSMFLITASSCGYLDEDLLIDDEQFEQSMTFDAMSISGSGWGCGGGGSFSFGRRHARAPHFAMGGLGLSGYATSSSGYYVNMRDRDLLELTDIDAVEVGEGDEPGTVAVPAEVYYEALAARNASIGAVYD